MSEFGQVECKAVNTEGIKTATSYFVIDKNEVRFLPARGFHSRTKFSFYVNRQSCIFGEPMVLWCPAIT